MFDVIGDGLRWLVLLALGLPILYALGHALLNWGLKPSRQQEAPDEPVATRARIEDLGIVQDGHSWRLPIKNLGDGPARNVHVYLNNRPITDFRSEASAEQYPISKLKPGDQHSYRIALGPGAQGKRVRLRIEWEDASGTQVWESVLKGP